ncbi:chaplin family protein [Streptomyces sp. NPDC016845]|uniref:chaplin n=1 Tax=Streptomyces sp. NPDC016845 TaxID=3364972 RepID=UPI0037A693F5
MTVVAATGILSVPATGALALSGDQGRASGSPGVLSGNSVSIPVTIGANACGNSVDAVGGLNPATGDRCGNGAKPSLPSPPQNAREHEQQRPDEPPREPREAPGAPPSQPRSVPPAAEDVREDAPETAVRARADGERLAESGAGENLPAAAGAGAALVLGGAVLYRRTRTGALRR